MQHDVNALTLIKDLVSELRLKQIIQREKTWISLVNRDIEKTLYLGCMQVHRLEAYQRGLLTIRI